jgi:hypothetical protein
VSKHEYRAQHSNSTKQQQVDAVLSGLDSNFILYNYAVQQLIIKEV